MSALKQMPLSFPLNPALAREDFLVSDSNREALAWIDRWPNWKAPVLYIHGPAGAGKTHLASIWRGMAGPSAQIIEDIDTMVAGNRPQEEILFHLYNRVRQSPGSVLMTGSRPLAMVQFAIPDLASRLRACPQVAIGLPDEDLLRVLLVKLFADRQMRIDVNLIEYIIPRMERSFEAASDIVAELDRISLAEMRPASLSMARKLLDPHQEALFL